jgi:hypothetical protein
MRAVKVSEMPFYKRDRIVIQPAWATDGGNGTVVPMSELLGRSRREQAMYWLAQTTASVAKDDFSLAKQNFRWATEDLEAWLMGNGEDL